jgi:hypothetical protein
MKTGETNEAFLRCELVAEVAFQMADVRDEPRAMFRWRCIEVADEILALVDPNLVEDLDEVVGAHLYERDLHKHQHSPGHHAA